MKPDGSSRRVATTGTGKAVPLRTPLRSGSAVEGARPHERRHRLWHLMTLTIVLQMFYYRGWPIRPDRLAWAALITIIVVQFFRRRLARPPFGWLELLMTVFTALVATSLVLSGGLDPVPQAVGYAVTLVRTPEVRINEVLNLTVFPFIVYVIARQVPFDRRNAAVVVQVFAWIGLYLAITAIGERFGVQALVWPGYIVDRNIGTHFGRARGPFVDSVLMGLNETVCLIAVLVCLQFKPGMVKRIALLLSIPLLLAGIYFTNTRGPWVVLAACLVATGLFKTKARSGAQICVALILCGFLFGGASKFSLLNGTLFEQRQNTVEDRKVNYQVALAMGLDNQPFGVGFSNMGSHFMRYWEREGSPDFGGWDGNHNEYLGLFAEVGIPTLLCYIAILLTVAARCMICIRRADDDEVRLIGLLGLCAMVGLTIIGMFNQIRSAPYHLCVAYFLAGVAASAASVASRRESDQRSIDPRAPSGRMGHRCAFMVKGNG